MRYLPLAVKLAAIRFAEGNESLTSLWERLQAEPQTLDPGDGVVAIFSTYYADRAKAPAAWQLLVRIASFPALEAPQAALYSGQADYYSAVDSLINLGLIDFIGTDRLALHPLLGTQVQHVEPQAVQDERERTMRWLLQYAHRYSDDYKALEQERANLLGLLDWFTQNRQWDSTVDLLRDLFNYLRVRGQWEEALQRLETVLGAVDEIGQAWNRAWAYLHRGIVHTLRGDYALAEADIDQADHMFAEVGDRPYRGNAIYRRATLLIARGEMGKAREQLKQAIALMGGAEPLRSARAHAHERLGELLATQGELKEAQQQLQQTLALGDREGRASANIALGDQARRAGDYRAARRYFDAAARLIGKIRDVLQRAALHQHVGYFHYYQGRHDKALKAFKAASDIYEELKYPPGQANAQHALGNVALARQDLESARKHYDNALKINTNRSQTAGAAHNRYQLALVTEREGQLDEAEAGYKEALRAAEEMKDKGLQAAALHQLSGLALTRGDLDEGAACNLQARRLAAEAGDRLTEASAQYYQGLLQAKEGDLQVAEETLAKAHAAFVKLEAPQAEAVAAALQKLRGGSSLAPDDVAAGGVVVGCEIEEGGVVTGSEIEQDTAGHAAGQSSPAPKVGVTVRAKTGRGSGRSVPVVVADHMVGKKAKGPKIDVVVADHMIGEKGKGPKIGNLDY